MKNFIGIGLMLLGALCLFLTIPMAISGGPGQEGKAIFLFNMMTFAACGIISGLALFGIIAVRRWVPLAVIFVMMIQLGCDIAQGIMGPNGDSWLQRNNLVPLALLFLIYSEFYLIRAARKNF